MDVLYRTDQKTIFYINALDQIVLRSTGIKQLWREASTNLFACVVCFISFDVIRNQLNFYINVINFEKRASNNPLSDCCIIYRFEPKYKTENEIVHRHIRCTTLGCNRSSTSRTFDSW